MEITHGHEWTGEVEELLEKLRINCVNLSEYHRQQYYHYKGYGKYFRIPIILLASINSTASVGLQPVLQQQIISGITCLIGMLMGILGAIELYLGIQDAMELELKQSKEFYSLAIDVYKVLALRRENRGGDGKDYLNSQYSYYVKLCESSNLLTRKLKMDMLISIPDYTMDSPAIITNMYNRPSSSIYTKPRPSLNSDNISLIELNKLSGNNVATNVVRDVIPKTVETVLQESVDENQELLGASEIVLNTALNIDTQTNTDGNENV